MLFTLLAAAIFGLQYIAMRYDLRGMVRGRRLPWTGASRTKQMAGSTKDNKEQHLKVIEFSPNKYCDQSQSLLFSMLPGEIRDRIYSYALAPYDDLDSAYADDTCYKRADYTAPQKASTILLRTCQRIYQEAFFYPFATAEHSMFLTAADRRPDHFTTIQSLQPALNLIYKIHGETEMASLRVFAQLCSLESGYRLESILNMEAFYPRSMTITIRHTDCWFWESDEALRVGGEWVTRCRFPASLRELRVQIESLERKKNQVDHVASEMIRKWNFRLRDDSVLSARNSIPEITRWSGSSIWGNRRWVRDETRPETLDYYLATVAWRPAQQDVEWSQADCNIQPLPGVFAVGGAGSYATQEIEQAGVAPGASAADIVAAVTAWRNRIIVPAGFNG